MNYNYLFEYFPMLLKLNSIILYSLIAFFVAMILYPVYIELLKKLKFWKEIREEWAAWGKAEIFNKLHGHKAWTPTMWAWLFLIIVAIMVLFSYVLQYLGYINNSLITRQETYVILFWFFSLGIWWMIDDYMNIKKIWKVRWLPAIVKMIWMLLFSAFISYWFYVKLWIDYINLWPLGGEVHIGLLFPLITFIFTVMVVNAINFTDWLDGLAGGLLIMVLFVLWMLTFFYQWYLSTTIIWIVLGWLLAFLWFNINPAKIFMWDSWALALGGLISCLVYLLNINVGIMIPFILLFSLFWLEFFSSALQIFWKKVFKRKLFPIAPFHHLLEHGWRQEHTIVMKFWLIQWVLTWLTIVLLFYQFHS